jgi:hypothetical protein
MGAFPVYRVVMGKRPEKFRHGLKNPAMEMGKRTRKNSGIVGNFPQRERKHLPVHETFITAASVV